MRDLEVLNAINNQEKPKPGDYRSVMYAQDGILVW